MFAKMMHLHLSDAVLNLAVTLPVDGLFLTALIWEFILTFMLMYIVMAVSTDYRAEGSGAGLAIGGVIALEALVGGPICGASMNPARSIGRALITGDLNLLWCYIERPFRVPYAPQCFINCLGVVQKGNTT